MMAANNFYNYVTDLFNTGVNPKDIVNNTYFPEPSFLIQIIPTLANGDKTFSGQSVVIPGFRQPITSMQLVISDSKQVTTLMSNTSTIATFEGIYVKDFSTENYVTEKHGSATLNLTIVNFLNIILTQDLGLDTLTDSGYDLDSPFLNLFQAGYIVTITMFNEGGGAVPLFVGAIGDFGVDYDNSNISISLNVESFLTILSRSACVQTADNATGLNTLTSKLYNFDALLTKLLDETIMSQWMASIQYYSASNEVAALGDKGSAISQYSSVYVTTSPTASKLQVIAEALYPYQRVFYVDNSGNFIITPLQSYYDDSANWDFSFNNTENAIPGFKISIQKNTATIQNRTFLTIQQLFAQFTATNNTGSNTKSSAYTVATPSTGITSLSENGSLSAGALFPRLNEFVTSGQYLQTLFAVQELNKSIIQNAGLLNLTQRFNNIDGLTNNATLLNGNQDIITTTDGELDKLKYYLNTYASRALAEQLFNETKITIKVPTNLTYQQSTNSFRQIPLNQLVNMPTTNNQIVDNISQYFCYGYRLTFNAQEGAMTELYLTKPFTYTSLWSLDQVVLLGETHL